MINRDLLIEIIADQAQLRWNDSFIHRQAGALIPDGKEIIIISGVRRCGKSTLLQEIRSQNKEQAYYLNFDDERLINFSVDDFQPLYELFIELYGVQHTFYFDEIQNVKGWERFVRRLHDYGNKIYITGSNASMLSRELGTHLTGRFISKELFPFSFIEFIDFKGQSSLLTGLLSSEKKANIKALFSEYFKTGGFPEFLAHQNSEYLQSLYQSIFYRDIMVRNKLTNEHEFLELVHYLATNLSKPFSNNNLVKTLRISSPTTIKQYVAYLQDTYLFFSINKFDYSLKKQVFNPKKGYFIDQALARQIGFSFSSDRGRVFENIVFLELKRRGYELFYHRQKFECDFVGRKNGKIVSLIQVTVSIMDFLTRERELRGLVEAIEAYGLKEGFIITESEEENIEIGAVKIHVLPAWKWLLNKI